MRRVTVLVLLVATIGTACSGNGSTTGRTSSRLVIHSADGDVTLSVEIADAPAERARGLMGRRSLPADAGMAFVWDGPVQARFWMKDTLIPLSIAFWDASGRIVAIRGMEPCRRDPCPTYDAGMPYVGAVEANEGFFTDHGVAVGDRVELVMDGG